MTIGNRHGGGDHGAQEAVHGAVSLLAAAAFALTAGLKAWSTLNPPRCTWEIPGPDGVQVPDPLHPWLWWGGRVAVPVECAIAFLLVRPRTRRLGAVLGAGFVLLAAGTLAILTSVTKRDLTAMCGCFGPWELPLRTHLALDGAFLGLLFLVLAGGRPPGSTPLRVLSEGVPPPPP